MSLQERITDDLRSAMKARDRERTSALRMALAAMKNAAEAAGRGPQGELSDDEVQALLRTEVKRRREAAAAFREGGRDESATKEEAEAATYETYLPTQLSDQELDALVTDAIAEVGATSPKEMGQVMKVAMARTGGRADGSRVSAAVTAKLTG